MKKRLSKKKFEKVVNEAFDEAIEAVDEREDPPTPAEKEWSKTWALAEKSSQREADRVEKLMNSDRVILLRRLDPSARKKRSPILDNLNFVFSVERLARDEGSKRAVRELTVASLDWPYPSPARGRGSPRRPVVVEVEVRLMSYLTKAVPERLRTRTFKARSVGDVLVRAAEMYDRIYREDERLGGEDTTKRDARLRRQKKPRPLLINRDEGPYIWGHDIGDLVFEQLCLRWTGDRSCKIGRAHV